MGTRKKYTLCEVLTAYTIGALLGYVIGSFPTAYLLVQWKAKIDIRQAGSGNVGTLNAMEVTGSKGLGIAVLIIDVLKGAFAVVLTMVLFGQQFWIMGIAGLSTIAGHSFPVWLKFKGGRGLATAAGVFMTLGWIFIVVWVVVWVVSYLPFRKVHAGNIVASMISPIVIAGVPESTLSQTLPGFTSATNLLYFSIAFCALVLVTHRETVALFMKRTRSL